MREKIKFFDPSIRRKRKNSNKNFQIYSGMPLPSEVEISESGICNRKCSFCPRSAADYNHVKEFISRKLHSKLCKELKEVGYAGVVRYSGFVEPLLDKNIYNLIREVYENLSGAKIELVTNGDVLNLSRLKKLFNNGLSTILISVYDSKEDAEKFEKMCKNLNLNSDQYVIRHRYLPPEKDFGITMSNRAGMMENAEYKVESLKEPLEKKCYYPSYTFFMDYNGDVLMCPHDWGKKMILGNLNRNKFIDIWNSKKSINIRKKLNKANRKFVPCNVCDVKGELIGEKHAKEWEKINL